MDEAYVHVKGEWMYLYGAVDKAGKTVDFLLSRTPMPHPTGQLLISEEMASCRNESECGPAST